MNIELLDKMYAAHKDIKCVANCLKVINNDYKNKGMTDSERIQALDGVIYI